MGFWQFATGGGGSGGSGDVVGPASSTDFGVPYFDDTTGKLLGSSAATITAAGSLTIPSGQAILIPAGSKTVPGLAFSDETNDGIYSRAASLISFAMDGKEAAYIGGGYAAFSGQINLGQPSQDLSTTAASWGIEWMASGTARVSNASTGAGRLLTAKLVEANTAGSGAPNVLAATESGTVLTNEGTTAKNYHTLPSATAGLVFQFVCQDADGIRITANTDDTIRVIDKVTAAAGYIESTTIGSVVTLVAINATEWIATSIHGVWTDGTFTYDDTSLTTP